MEQLISVPFIAVLIGLFAADYFFVEKYRKVIDAIKQETIDKKVSPALKKLIDELIDSAKTDPANNNTVEQFALILKEKVGEIEFIKLANLTQRIFEATEVLRKNETLFDKYLIAMNRTMVLSCVLAIDAIIPLLSKCFAQQCLANYIGLLTKIYYAIFILLFIFWAYYLIRCINTRCGLSKLWKDYI